MSHVSDGWPVEYGGPRNVLTEPHIPWAGRPRIVEVEGKWRWTCEARFLTEQAGRDIARLANDGWRVRVIAKQRGVLLISIEEHEQ